MQMACLRICSPATFMCICTYFAFGVANGVAWCGKQPCLWAGNILSALLCYIVKAHARSVMRIPLPVEEVQQHFKGSYKGG